MMKAIEDKARQHEHHQPDRDFLGESEGEIGEVAHHDVRHRDDAQRRHRHRKQPALDGKSAGERYGLPRARINGV
ncbi:MAG: hypothetical protein HY322_20345 [Betaproteobacteria bacterium]|nr:hypothetical protein [Betaproteobacteria bacterium]